MSRIGKQPIILPPGVSIARDAQHVAHIQGPRGKLSQPLHPDITFEAKDGLLLVQRPTEQKRHKALHGLYRALLQNAILGLTQGYKRSLELIGVGYKASSTGQQLELHLGYAHPIYFVLPEQVTVTTEISKTKRPTIHLESSDKQLLGQVCAKIKGLRRKDPYKGKGIYFVGEQIRRKAGKTASK